MSLIIKNKGNYPEFIVHAESDSFGDQTVMLVQEHRDGSKTVIAEMINPEGSWAGRSALKSWARGLIKSMR